MKWTVALLAAQMCQMHEEHEKMKKNIHKLEKASKKRRANDRMLVAKAAMVTKTAAGTGKKRERPATTAADADPKIVTAQPSWKPRAVMNLAHWQSCTARAREHLKE